MSKLHQLFLYIECFFVQKRKIRNVDHNLINNPWLPNPSSLFENEQNFKLIRMAQEMRECAVFFTIRMN